MGTNNRAHRALFPKIQHVPAQINLSLLDNGRLDLFSRVRRGLPLLPGFSWSFA
jgi:hypothetical protein